MVVALISCDVAGLESIPLSENAQDRVDLGKVNSNEAGDAFESSVSINEMAENTGLQKEQLDDYSNFDHTTKNVYEH